jgi:hypothetical protein
MVNSIGWGRNVCLSSNTKAAPRGVVSKTGIFEVKQDSFI